jgi:hypothetical protein
MRVLTINELLPLTRIELCDLARRISNRLPKYADCSPERANALTSLRNIRYALARSKAAAESGTVKSCAEGTDGHRRREVAQTQCGSERVWQNRAPRLNRAQREEALAGATLKGLG